ncbi:hypothetical protein AAIB41_06265 [Brucella sp. BE17]|uniref:hypothetical protein n=1 Tax=Brucella sp. BE17 TaxID=3142977 RepID=UPI0031B9E121
MFKLIAASIVTLPFLIVTSTASMAGWQDELKKAGKKSEQFIRSVQQPQGPEAKRLLRSDVRNTLENPQREINKFCTSAGQKISGVAGLLQGVAQALNPQADDCNNPTPSTSKP